MTNDLYSLYVLNAIGVSFQKLSVQTGIPKMTLYDRIVKFRKGIPAPSRHNLLRVVHEEYLKSDKYTTAEKDEIKKWMDSNTAVLIGEPSENFYTESQLLSTTIRETSPIRDWSEDLVYGLPDEDVVLHPALALHFLLRTCDLLTRQTQST